jgi:hypothetical protein
MMSFPSIKAGRFLVHLQLRKSNFWKYRAHIIMTCNLPVLLPRTLLSAFKTRCGNTATAMMS